METGDENSISPMTEASIQGSPMEGVKYPALMGNANRRVLRGIHNLIVGGSAQVISKRPSQEQFAASPNQKQFSFSYPQIEKKQKRAAITGAENLVDDDSCCTVPMEVILPLLMAPDVEMGRHLSNMLHFRPSLLAAAAVFTAQCTLDGFKSWSKCSEQHSQYTQEDLLECSRMMVHMHNEASDGKLTGVYRKFNTPKYWYVSACEPALFLLGEPM